MGLLNWFRRPQYTVINGMTIKLEYGSDGQITLDLLSIPAIAQALTLIKKDIGQTPLNKYFRTADGGRVRVRDELDNRLSLRPNKLMNASVFIETAIQQALIHQSFLVNDADGIRLLPFGLSERFLSDDGTIMVAEYVNEKDKDDVRFYNYDDVVHLFHSADNLGCPYPIDVRFSNLLSLGSSLYSYTTNLYNRGGALAGYLTTDKPIKEETKTQIIQAFKSQFKNSNSASSDDGDIKLSALDNGWKFQSLNLTPQELMILETKKDWEKDVGRMFNLGSWKLGLTEDYHYATAEQADREYLKQTLNPIFTQFEREINSKWIDPIDRPFYYVEFNTDKLVQLDANTQATIEDLGIKNGSLLPNEKRAIHNQTALPGGSSLLTPTTYQTADYGAAAEALKLEGLKLDNALKAKQLAEPVAPIAPTTPPESKPDAPAAPPASELPQDDLSALRSIQRSVREQLPTDLAAGVARLACDLQSLHNLPSGSLSSFAETYLASASKRVIAGNEDYEANRATNAINLEAMKLAYGITHKAKWIGGEFDGELRSVGEAFKDNIKHPPFSGDNTTSYLVRGK